MRRFHRKTKKTLAMAKLTLVVSVLFCTIGVCSAYLITSKTMENVFTVGQVSIRLEESAELDLILVPGKVIAKDPTVTVVAGSVSSYLFVKVEEKNSAKDFLDYEIDGTWTALPGYAGIYYMEISLTDADASFPVLKNNAVTVKETVKKETLATMTEDTYPELCFSAYAIQKNSIESPEKAWQILVNSSKQEDK